MGLIKIADASELEDGQSKVVFAGGKEIALFRISSRFYATSNECPHQSGPLGEGSLEGRIVSCPWHGWKFDVTSGESPVVPSVKISTYSVVEKEGEIFIEI